MNKIIFPIRYNVTNQEDNLEKKTILGKDENGTPVEVTFYASNSDSSDTALPVATAPITYIDPQKEVLAYVEDTYIGPDTYGNPIYIHGSKPIYKEEGIPFSNETDNQEVQQSMNFCSEQITQATSYLNKPNIEELGLQQYSKFNSQNFVKPMYGDNVNLTPNDNDYLKEPKRRTTREYADEVYKHAIFKVNINNEEIYMFKNTYYEKISEPNFRRYINLICDTNGMTLHNPRLIEDICSYIKKDYRPAISDCRNNSKYVAFQDKILDLDTMAIYDGNPGIFLTWCLNCKFTDYFRMNDFRINSVFQMPLNFCNFINTIANYEESLIQRIWQSIGLLLTNDVACKKIILFQGVGNSGKSKLAEFIKSLMSDGCVSELTFADLGEKFSLSIIPGKHMICSMDLPFLPISDQSASKLKSITSGGSDEISVEPKYQPKYTYKPEIQCLFGTNHKVQFKIEDPNFIKRFVAIPFNVKISDDKINPNLLESFISEIPYVIYYALQAYKELKTNHYNFSGNYPLNGNSKFLTQNESDDFIEEFVAQYCFFNENEFCSTNALYIAYCKFINSFKSNTHLDIKGFSRKLKEYYGICIQSGKRNCNDIYNTGNGFWGITLKEDLNMKENNL